MKTFEVYTSTDEHHSPKQYVNMFRNKMKNINPSMRSKVWEPLQSKDSTNTINNVRDVFSVLYDVINEPSYAYDGDSMIDDLWEYGTLKMTFIDNVQRVDDYKEFVFTKK